MIRQKNPNGIKTILKNLWTKHNLKIQGQSTNIQSIGWIFSPKIGSQGEFISSLTAKLQIPQIKFPPNSLLTPN